MLLQLSKDDEYGGKNTYDGYDGDKEYPQNDKKQGTCL